MKLKWCPKCERNRWPSSFYANPKHGLSSYCRDCTKAYAKQRHYRPGASEKKAFAFQGCGQ